MEQIKGEMKRLLKESNFEGVVLVGLDGKEAVVYDRGFRKADLKEEVTNDTQFDIASVTKMFTAVAILQLIENGELKFTDSLNKWINSKKYKDITIEQLLNHTSGIPEYMESIIESPINQHIIEGLDGLGEPYCEPGTTWIYTNTNYVILAEIIKNITGVTYQNYINQQILFPLQMHHTDFSGKINETEGMVYDYIAETYRPVAENPNYSSLKQFENVYGDGGIYSTVDDLYKFSEALFNGKLIGLDMLNKALQPSTLSEGNPDGYGLGFLIKNSGNIVGHSGGWPGYSAHFYRFQEEKTTLVLLTNQEINPLYEEQLLSALFNIANKKRYQLPIESKQMNVIKTELNMLEFLCGKYILEDDIKSPIEIFIENERLYLKIMGQSNVELLCVEEHVLWLRNTDCFIDFTAMEQFVFIENNNAIQMQKVYD